VRRTPEHILGTIVQVHHHKLKTYPSPNTNPTYPTNPNAKTWP